MIYIEHKQLANACRILFNHMWDKGKEFAEVEKLLKFNSEAFAV
jgi:hypothetical protein